MDRVTFATSPGIVWLALAAHFAAGLDVARARSRPLERHRRRCHATALTTCCAASPTPCKENPLKHNTVLIVLSLLNALFFALHLTGDIVFGLEKGGREILVGVLILAVYLYGTVGLHERLAGYIILLLGGLASAALPVMHTMGRPLGERFAQLPGGFFFIWTLLTTGATGLVAFVLSVQAIWSLRARRGASA